MYMTLRRLGSSAQSMFADRIPESEALARSLAVHVERLRNDGLESDVRDNVLSFYGVGGVGKTELSKRLAVWLQGGLGDASDWGPPPVAGPVAVVRWDLFASSGAVDPVDLLAALRVGLLGGRRRWTAFDLAFASYVSAVRPGETLDLRDSSALSGTLLDALAGIASDLGSLDVITSLSTAAIRRVVDLAMTGYRRHRELSRFPTLGDVLARSQSLAAGTQSPELAADVAWVLTEQIDAIPPAERPLLVIFIDTFERVQSHDSLEAEATLNRLVASLPHALFVILGRDQVAWHSDSRVSLPYSGPRTWPGMVPGRLLEPRAHLLGRLSDEDAAAVFNQRRITGGWRVSPTLIAELVQTTAGLPLHMDAVCKVADNLTQNGTTPLTIDELGGDLRDLVRRLLLGLSEEEARAFHAACLLPYFDVTLAAEVGQVSEAAVESCCRRTLVEGSDAVGYPFRVHDTIRALVRAAGSTVKGGWTAGDWRRAAERGLAEASRRHQTATAGTLDRPILEALGLALAIAVEHDVSADWLIEAVQAAPTIRGLEPLAPPVPSGPTDSDAVALVQLIRALNAPKDEASLTKLREILDGPTRIAEQGGRWLAYRLRAHHRREEALVLFDELLSRFPENSALYHRQQAVTLRGARRFRDEAALAEAFQVPQRHVAQRLHGHDRLSLRARLLRARSQRSRRYGFDLETTAWSEEARFRPVPQEVIEAMFIRAVNLGESVREADALIVMAYRDLHDERAFDHVFGRLLHVERAQSSYPRASLARLLAMRTLAGGSDEYAERAWAEASRPIPHRSSAWIFTEFALELVGRPFLPSKPSGWSPSKRCGSGGTGSSAASSSAHARVRSWCPPPP